MSKPVFRKGIGIKILICVILFFGMYAVWVTIWSQRGNSLEIVRLGIDRCYHCGMIVSDLRFSVSVLDQDKQGHTVTRHFDDPGCFQAFAKEHLENHLIGIAHDFRTGQAISLEHSRFIHTEAQTPMGSGIIAIEAKSSDLGISK